MARIRDVVANMQVVDGDSLLTPQLMARIVTAVMSAMESQREDDHARRRDTKVGGAAGSGGCCSSCESEMGS